MRGQSPLELVFEDISTFDAENPIVGSLLREIDLKKNQSDSDFIKLLSSHPGKEFEIKKRLDRPRGTSNFGNNNNNNNNNNGGGSNNNLGGNNNLFGPGGEPPSLPSIEDFLNGGPRPPPKLPPAPSINGNLFNNTDTGILPATNDFNVQTSRANLFVLPTIWSNKGTGNNLFGSQVAMADPREEEKKTKTQQDVDDFLYELPERTMPDLELGDGLLNSLGTNAQNLFDVNAPPSKKEEEEEILKDIMDEYEIDKIRDTMDEIFTFFMVEIASSL